MSPCELPEQASGHAQNGAFLALFINHEKKVNRFPVRLNFFGTEFPGQLFPGSVAEPLTL